MINVFSYFDYQIAVTVIIIATAWKWGDWKNWSKYYSTILFYICNDIIVALIFYNYPLWQLESPLLKTTFSDLLITMLFFPAALLLYLPYFPNNPIKKIKYIILWTLVFVFIEAISYASGYITYHNGWNVWWTALFDVNMLILLRIHYKKPLLAWLLSISYIAIAIFWFKLPFNLIK